VTEKLIAGLSGAPIAIVSGLALGIDAIAHRAALKAGLPTIAIPGSGLNPDVLYPHTNQGLAEEIVKANGALLSEFPPDFQATPWGFPQRNRIMAGISHATLVIEATNQSGTLITSRLATEYNRDVLAVPGSIFSANSAGPHILIKLGATPVTESSDILEALSITAAPTASQDTLHQILSPDEEKVASILREPLSRDELIRTLALPINKANILLSSMELKGLIQESLGKVHLK
jgi:DNA processing protein